MNKPKKIFFFARNQSVANNALEEFIKNNFDKSEIEHWRKSLSEFAVVLKDGTVYQSRIASESIRGYKYDQAYIVGFVEQRFLDFAVKPSLVFSPLPEGEQIKFL